MAKRTAQLSQVGKRTLEISNLRKVLFPDQGIIKAELIEYYLKLAPTILAHVKGRLLSLVRYPDGVGGESFFQKNRPDWAPDWIEHAPLGEEPKDYIIASEDATLAWLANLACIELHQMHARKPHLGRPDYVVYDFDPPEHFTFAQVAELAIEFKTHLEALGYHPMLKTTGRKGLHLCTPIEPRWDFATAFEAAKALSLPFVSAHSNSVTLQIPKQQRKDKLLLDIYRNRPSQTIIAPYSVRGLPGAPVSTPLSWQELESIQDPRVFNLRTVPQRVLEHGDPWEAFAAYATPLHTQRTSKASPPNLLPAARTRKTPEQLHRYAQKRQFEKTPEPQASLAAGTGNSFVVHRHHASRLHYDLRLEQGGVLKSWAVPKGLPPRPGIMRLAVNVEDHPLAYLNFEGAIPKGEYGGGMMWKFVQGRYEITRQKPTGFYFRLQSRELNAEYRVHRSRDNQWLLERVDTPQKDWLRTPAEPMLARLVESVPNSPDYFYEVKWDGLRALIYLDEGQIRIRGRSGIDLTQQFPDLLDAERAMRANSGIFDGEIVCLDPQGKPDFQKVIHRMQQRSSTAIERAKAKHPATCYLFDCLYLDGRPVVEETLARRREWLADSLKDNSAYRISEVVDDGPALFDAVRQMGLEGVMAKLRTSPYSPGKRSEAWLKIKTHQSLECLVIGYTRGRGDRSSHFGALHLARNQQGTLKYLGKVGTGFGESTLGAVSSELKKLTIISRPIKEKPLDDAQSTWVEPKLVCEVQFASMTKDGLLRAPVFVRLRPDLVIT